MIGLIFSFILFFFSIYFLFKGSLAIAAAIMGFSIVWFIVGAGYRKFELLYLSMHKKKEEPHELSN